MIVYSLVRLADYYGLTRKLNTMVLGIVLQTSIHSQEDIELATDELVDEIV